MKFQLRMNGVVIAWGEVPTDDLSQTLAEKADVIDVPLKAGPVSPFGRWDEIRIRMEKGDG